MENKIQATMWKSIKSWARNRCQKWQNKQWLQLFFLALVFVIAYVNIGSEFFKHGDYCIRLSTWLLQSWVGTLGFACPNSHIKWIKIGFQKWLNWVVKKTFESYIYIKRCQTKKPGLTPHSFSLTPELRRLFSVDKYLPDSPLVALTQII